MKGTLIIHKTSFSSTENYFQYAKQKVKEQLISRLPYLGMIIADLEDLALVRKHKMGRDDVQKGDEYIFHTYRALGVSLVSVTWSNDKCIISVPVVEPDYTEAKKWIASYIPHQHG